MSEAQVELAKRDEEAGLSWRELHPEEARARESSDRYLKKEAAEARLRYKARRLRG